MFVVSICFALALLRSATPATAARRYAHEHPRAARNLLWAWFAVLVLGELGTTLWWHLDLPDCTGVCVCVCG
jgi:hypothetical protein